MRTKKSKSKQPAEQVVKDIRRRTRRHFSAEDKIWIEELGLYHYKARAYSPTLGRFLQTDPIGYEDQYNLYAYVGNDPINGVDPSGMVTACVQQTDKEGNPTGPEICASDEDRDRGDDDQDQNSVWRLGTINVPGGGDLLPLPDLDDLGSVLKDETQELCREFIKAGGDPAEAITARVRRGTTAAVSSAITGLSGRVGGQALVAGGERIGRFIGDKSSDVGATVRGGARGAKFGRRAGIAGLIAGGIAGAVFAPEIQAVEDRLVKDICGI